MIDTHTHTMFSADSNEIPEKLIESAIEKGLKYLAVTDHVDRDYLFGEIRKTEQIDMSLYFPKMLELKEKYCDKINFAIGAEFGYTKAAEYLYRDIAENYDLDIIINSVHTVNGRDAYFPDFFDGKEKASAYLSYLLAIRESLDVNYQFDVISHIGYITRNAPYPDKALKYDDFKDIIDDILKTIITKGKALEVNTRSISHNAPFMPSREIIERYRELKGELLTFASDAHKADQAGANYDKVAVFLKSLGYKYLTGFIKHRPVMYEI